MGVCGSLAYWLAAFRCLSPCLTLSSTSAPPTLLACLLGLPMPWWPKQANDMLVEYIMVMLGNQKTVAAMAQDLAELIGEVNLIPPFVFPAHCGRERRAL